MCSPQSLLLYGKYSEEASSMEANAIVKQYKDVIDICPQWEDGYFHLAKYYDKIMFAMIDEKDRNEKQGWIVFPESQSAIFQASISNIIFFF